AQPLFAAIRSAGRTRDRAPGADARLQRSILVHRGGDARHNPAGLPHEEAREDRARAGALSDKANVSETAEMGSAPGGSSRGAMQDLPNYQQALAPEVQ